MRPIMRILFFSLMVFLFSFKLLLAEQPSSEFSPEVFKRTRVIMDDFLVNNDSIFSIQSEPAMAVDGAGNFVIAWEDYRNGNWDIYYQKYDSSGTPLSSNSKVNTDFGTADQHYPAIRIDYSGNFMITWEDYRNGTQGDIYAQKYDFSGNPLGYNFKVNDDTGINYQNTPSVAMDHIGNVIITWSDSRNGNIDVFAQRYNSSGVPLGSNFKVNDAAEIATIPTVASDGSGNFVITWTDQRNGDYDIYAQRFDSTGTPLGFNFKVNDDAGAAQQ